MKTQLERIKNVAEQEILAAKTQKEIEDIRVKYLGKKGELTALLKQMGALSSEERPIIGQLANEVRDFIGKNIDSTMKQIKKFELDRRLEEEKLDVTLPGVRRTLGHRHPLSIVLDDVKGIFIGMGFDIVEGPEI